MRKLLRANLDRLKRDKVYWGGMICMIAYCIMVVISQYKTMKEYAVECQLDTFLFGSFMMIGIELSVVISLFVGTEYSDGTIRNKIVVGMSRGDIYLANSITCSVGAVVSALLATLFVMIVGVPLFGWVGMGFSDLVLMILIYAMAAIAYASIYNLIAMLCSNKAYTAIINVVLSFGLLFASIYLQQRLSAQEMIDQGVLGESGGIVFETVENPSYLTGTAREIHQFFFDLLPSGQAMQVVCVEVIHPYRLLLYSAIVIIVCNAIGVWFFKKKDLK